MKPLLTAVLGTTITTTSPLERRIGTARLQLLVARIYALGPRPLYKLLADLDRGAPLPDALESYARLYALRDFITELGGDRLPGALRRRDDNCLRR